jgi:hypothetical protein
MGRRRKIVPFHTLIADGLKEMVLIKSRGRSKKASKEEAIVVRQVMKAVHGDEKAFRYVIRNLKEDTGIKRRGPMWASAGPDGAADLYYGNGLIKRTRADGRVEWLKRGVGGKEELIPNPSKAQIRYWEGED